MAATRKGRGRNSRFPDFARVSSMKGRTQRHDRRRDTVGKDSPQDGLHMITPGSMNPRKVGR